jgi:hypothetical protein
MPAESIGKLVFCTVFQNGLITTCAKAPIEKINETVVIKKNFMLILFLALSEFTQKIGFK